MGPANPYLPPGTDVAGPSAAKPGIRLTGGMMVSLKKSEPWIRFLAILGFLFMGLMVLVSVIMAITMLAQGGATEIVAVAVLYLFVGMLYFFPTLFLWRYAGALKQFGQDRDGKTLEEAFRHHYSFWRLIGILTLAVISIYIVAIVGVLIAAALGAS